MNRICYNCFVPFDDTYEICPNCGDVPAEYIPEPFQLLPGTVLAKRYIIGKAIGMGGFGITYIAWDQQMDTIVAVKEFYPSSLVNRAPGTKNVILPEGKRMGAYRYGFDNFIEEARSMVRYSSHKNIVNVFEYFEENNTAYLVMEYLDGFDINDYMIKKGGKLSCETSVKIALCIISALKEIHKNGVIHRDIAPDNIKLCRNGKVKLFDFGAARFENNDKKTKILKPGFAPPEQYDSLSNQGPWTDIYALGATLYYMLTGIKPEESTNRKIKDELVEPIKINPEIPEYLSNTVMKALALESHLRFQSVEEFEMALKREKKVTSLAKEKRRKKRNRIIGLSAAMAVVALVAGIFIAKYIARKEYATLPSALITVWVVSDEAYYEGAIGTINSEFEERYSTGESKIRFDVENSKRFSSHEELRKRFNSIPPEKRPNIIITTENDIAGNVSFGEIYDSIKEAEKYFVSDYGEIMFADELCTEYTTSIPLGFSIPVVYCFGESNDWNNTAIYSAAKGDTLESVFAQVPKEPFRYVSDSSEIDAAKSYAMSEGISSKAVPYGNGIYGAYITSFCMVIESDDEAENEVAKRYAEELLTTANQEELFNKNREKNPVSVPLNQNVVPNWFEITDLRGDLKFISDPETSACDPTKLTLKRKEEYL